MKKAAVVLFMFFAVQLFAIQKSELDIFPNTNDLAKSAGNAADGFYGSKELNTLFTSFSMMTGGYFTLGTTNGLADSPFDNHCDLTFGHPYALTSYPLFAVDGIWGRPDQLVFERISLVPEKNAESLFLEAAVENVGIQFRMTAVENGRAVELSLTLTNNDVVEHSFGLGLVIDPALGQWGDGVLEMNGAMVLEANVFDGETANGLILRERSSSPFGLGAQVVPTLLPDQIIVANWPDIYNAAPGELSLSDIADLYDLCLKFIWQEQIVPAGAQRTCTVLIQLLTPDFSQIAQMRWDMPTAFSMQDNLLFPRRLDTIVRVMNTGGGRLSDVTIDVVYPPELAGEAATDGFAAPANGSAYPSLAIQSKEIYEDIVVPIELLCKQNGRQIDRLTRNVFIPATPVSDEGLIVNIDSLWTTEESNLSLVFNVEKEETGQRVLNLVKENILLYDNEERIREFNMEKYGDGGSGLADVCFVLDCSGSMGDNISAVRTHLGEFADSLLARGFDYQIAIVTFSTTVDDVWDFSNDIDLLKDRLASINLWGGIEDSPSALHRASTLSWRDGAKRNIIWITDEPYPEENFTQEQIVDQMLAMDICVHGVGLLELQTDWFNPIVLPTGGNFYNIFGNFRDILLDVSRMKSQDKYLISYSPLSLEAETHQIRLKVHYAGLGGEATATINGGAALGKKLVCYPNPFNPIVRIRVDAQRVSDCRVDIYDILGRQIRHFEIAPHIETELLWDAHDGHGHPVSSGFYIIRLAMQDAGGSISSESQKVLYLK